MAEGEYRPGNDASEYIKGFWLPLSHKIEGFLHPQTQAGPISFQETFDLVYKCVDCGFSDRLHADLRDTILRHIRGHHVDLFSCLTTDCGDSQEPSVVKMIQMFDTMLADYILAVKGIAAAFSYLDKFLALKYSCKSLEEEMKILFCCEVAEHFIHDILSCVDRSPPFTLEPALLNRLFRNLQIVSGDQYGVLYSKLFARFVTDALPPMQEHDLDAHIAEVHELQAQMKHEQCIMGSLQSKESFSRNPAVKRSADD